MKPSATQRIEAVPAAAPRFRLLARGRIRIWPLLILLAGAAAAAVPPHQIEPLRFRAGDDLAWAAPELDDASWEEAQDGRARGNWWARSTVVLEEPGDRHADLALRVFVPGAFEVYWDGELVGGSGRVGTDRESERPGPFLAWVPLDLRHRRAGPHVVALRASSHHAIRGAGRPSVDFLDRGATTAMVVRYLVGFVVCVGVLLLAAVVFGLFHRALGRRPDIQLFALLCLAVALMVSLEYVRYFLPYSYPWHTPREIAISLLAAVVGVLLPAFVLARLELASGRILLLLPTLALGFAVLAASFDSDRYVLWVLRVATITAFGLALWGRYRQRPASTWVLAAVAPVLVPIFFTGLDYGDHWFFAGFVAVVLVLLIEMSVDLARAYRQRQEALVTAERLRYELLRKTIQPHFLMNALSAAIEYITDEPAQGVEVLRDLARELQAFFDVGDRASIPLAEELELCRRHVATMRHLLARPLHLEVSPPEPPGEVPPGVLLTLVENAIRHGDWTNGAKVAVSIHAKNGTTEVEVVNPVGADAAKGPERTGLAYVRRQLANTSADWGVACEMNDGRWVTRLRW